MKSVAVVVQEGAHAFGLGMISEVWEEPYHPEDDNPVFDVTICTPHPGRVGGAGGLDYLIENDLGAVAEADLVCVAPHDATLQTTHPAVVEALHAADRRGATIAAHCTAVFDLGRAGLLDGRECTTHWRYGERLATDFPAAIVTPDVLYVHDGNVLTGAGAAAGLDAFLYLIRKRFGSKVAATTARRIVVPPHRDGGQCQFVRTPVGSTEADTLGPLLEWALAHLDQPLSVDRLAEHARMSPRTLARRFRAETGTTPLQWVTSQRLALAEELLETTRLPVEQIARRCGFGNGATLRHHFGVARGTTPQAYRKAFGALEEPALS